MVEPIGDWPDFTRAILIVGKDDAGNPVGVFVDAVGNLAAILKGQKPDTTLATVALDASGRIIMVPYGTTEISGTATVTQAAKDREVQGADGATLRTLAVDANGQLVMVPRGASGNYMSVDASGYLTAVLKGVYGGTLTTIGVDYNGRIDAFLMDGADQWGQQLRIGNAEQAARLGALAKYDWRGQVVFQSDFSHGAFALFPSLSGTGAKIEISPLYWQTGGYALWMEGGSDASGYAYFYAGIGPSPSGKIGISINFSLVNQPAYVRVCLRHETMAYLRYGEVRLDYANKVIQVWNGASSAWETIAVFDFFVTPYIFSNLKLVISTVNNTYFRVMYNGQEFDRTDIALKNLGVSGNPRLVFEVWVYSNAGDTDAICLDSIVLTVNEPNNP